MAETERILVLSAERDDAAHASALALLARTSPPPAGVTLLVEVGSDVAAAEALVRSARELPAFAECLTFATVDRVAIPLIAASSAFDDFLVTPFSGVELGARIRHAAERARRRARCPRCAVGPIVVDREARRAFAFEREIALTRHELLLLEVLAATPGRVFSRHELMNAAWGVRYRESRTVDVHVHRLRRKLGAAAPLLRNVRGVGYALGGGGP